MALVMDAGQAGPLQEFLAQHVAPDGVDHGLLGEEAVPAYVEAVTLVGGGAGQPPHVLGGLKDQGGSALAA
jgi:hypothetical protein